jgi:asparagine synthase (glutamine-hydrolysing)
MCGIFGIIRFDGGRPSSEEIRRGNDLAAHRGPDSSGEVVLGPVGLGHRRLSIIDLTADGRQPMQYRGRYTITYNGEVYNFLEIRRELEAAGHRFQSRSDTEVILAAYDEWGAGCLTRFNGMWAFAIHDARDGSVFCARDRFGVKPFHWCRTAGGIAFASEIRQLLPLLPRRVADARVLDEYLSRGLEEHRPETFFRGIERLTAAHWMRIDPSAGTLRVERYFRVDADPAAARLGERDAVEQLRAGLLDAIKLRLRADVRVGGCLSGGLDSSFIASLAAPMYRAAAGTPFTAIHARSVEARTDESAFAREVAEHCGIGLHVVTPDLGELTAILERVVETQEEPFGGPSVLMQYCVMREARRLGCTVMLDGQGADEVLFGYESYFAPYYAMLAHRGRLVQLLRDVYAARNFKVSKPRALAQAALLLAPSLLGPIEAELRRALRPASKRLDPEMHHRLFGLLDFKQFQVREIELRCLPRLLRYEDRNSMRHGIETRLPFLDWRFVRLAVSIDDRLKFRNGFLKYLLRSAIAPDLPPSVVWRTNKFGFEAPTNQWLESIRPRVEDDIRASPLLASRIDRSRLGSVAVPSLWRAFSVARWERCFGVEGDG